MGCIFGCKLALNSTEELITDITCRGELKPADFWLLMVMVGHPCSTALEQMVTHYSQRDFVSFQRAPDSDIRDRDSRTLSNLITKACFVGQCAGNSVCELITLHQRDLCV